MSDLGADKAPEISCEMNKNLKHHSKWSAAIVSVIFIAAAITWLFNVPVGVFLTIAGGVVFGFTYR